MTEPVYFCKICEEPLRFMGVNGDTLLHCRFCIDLDQGKDNRWRNRNSDTLQSIKELSLAARVADKLKEEQYWRVLEVSRGGTSHSILLSTGISSVEPVVGSLMCPNCGKEANAENWCN